VVLLKTKRVNTAEYIGDVSDMYRLRLPVYQLVSVHFAAPVQPDTIFSPSNTVPCHAMPSIPSHPPFRTKKANPNPTPKRDIRVNANMSLAAHSRHPESGTQPSTPKDPVADRTVQIERMARLLLRRRIRFSHGTGGWFFSLQLPQSFETLVAACQPLSQG
jgi:hypothetical protein